MFKEGQSGNPDGRPKGSKNKTNASMKKWINDFLMDNKDAIAKDIKSLNTQGRVNAYLKLMDYIVVKEKHESIITSSSDDHKLFEPLIDAFTDEDGNIDIPIQAWIKTNEWTD